MTYEEFLQMPYNFITDVAKVIDIKIQYGLEFTEQEKQINEHILHYYEQAKIGSLRGYFEKCWDLSK